MAFLNYNRDMKKEITRIIPIIFALVLTACNASLHSKAYRDIICEDYFLLNKETLNKDNIKSSSQIKIVRSFVSVQNVITFDVDISQKVGAFVCDYVDVSYDDVTITFLDGARVPLVWNNHEIIRFDIFINKKDGKDIYSKDDFINIKNMYDNDLNDFSFLDRPYSE